MGFFLIFSVSFQRPTMDSLITQLRPSLLTVIAQAAVATIGATFGLGDDSFGRVSGVLRLASAPPGRYGSSFARISCPVGSHETRDVSSLRVHSVMFSRAFVRAPIPYLSRTAFSSSFCACSVRTLFAFSTRSQRVFGFSDVVVPGIAIVRNYFIQYIYSE